MKTRYPIHPLLVAEFKNMPLFLIPLGPNKITLGIIKNSDPMIPNPNVNHQKRLLFSFTIPMPEFFAN